MSWNHHHLLCGRPEMLPANNRDQYATVDKVLRSLAMLTSVHDEIKLVRYSICHMKRCMSSRKIWVRPWSNFHWRLCKTALMLWNMAYDSARERTTASCIRTCTAYWACVDTPGLCSREESSTDRHVHRSLVEIRSHTVRLPRRCGCHRTPLCCPGSSCIYRSTHSALHSTPAKTP